MEASFFQSKRIMGASLSIPLQEDLRVSPVAYPSASVATSPHVLAPSSVHPYPSAARLALRPPGQAPLLSEASPAL